MSKDNRITIFIRKRRTFQEISEIKTLDTKFKIPIQTKNKEANKLDK